MTEYFSNFAVCKNANDLENDNDKKKSAISATDDSRVTLVDTAIYLV